MIKPKILLALVITITFIGGIVTGRLLPANSAQQASKPLKIENAAQSKIHLLEKNMPKVDQQPSKVLIGYVQDYRDPNIVDYDKLTHVIFSFVHPMKDGAVSFNGDVPLNNLRAIVSKAKQHHTKVILGVGGWFHMNGGESYPYFKAAISNPISRTKLVNELAGIVSREHLDGVDIDFEHPHSSEDAANLSAFIKELSAKLHPQKKELSIAVYAKIHAVTLTETSYVKYESSMFQNVDHVNIMAYDGQWDDGYHAENLSPYPFTEKIVNYWASYFDKNHLSKEKLVLGVPLYAQPENPDVKQVSFEAIVKNNPANASADIVQMNGTTYYYNGDATMKKKTNLALDHGFGGMMLWEAGLDAKGSNSLTGVIHEVLADSSKGPVKYYSVKKN